MLEALRSFCPFNRQEEADKRRIIEFLEAHEDAYERSNDIAHMTASAWVVNKERTKVLMAYHNLYDSWAWLGGHADGEKDLLAVAIKEVKEESGVTEVIPLMEDIFSVEVLTVDGHEKRGEYVASHLHLNVTYLLEADEQEVIRACEGENSAVGWFEPEKAVTASTEPWFRERIYSKLNEKLYAWEAKR